MIARFGQTTIKAIPGDKNFVNALQDLLVNQVTTLGSLDLAALPIVPGGAGSTGLFSKKVDRRKR